MGFFATFSLTFNRELARKGEAEEVTKGLEEQTRTIPANVSRLEAKVARQNGRLEALHSIRPDLQMLKQLGREVQEAEVKMKQLEKAGQEGQGRGEIRRLEEQTRAIPVEVWSLEPGGQGGEAERPAT